MRTGRTTLQMAHSDSIMRSTQIFEAATINNAQKFKLESQLGSIEPGKVANLVLMKQSPLESVDA